MAPQGPNYPTTAVSGYPNTAYTQKDDIKSNCVKMIEAFKEERIKSLIELQENSIKQVKEINKTIQMQQRN